MKNILDEATLKMDAIKANLRQKQKEIDRMRENKSKAKSAHSMRKKQSTKFLKVPERLEQSKKKFKHSSTMKSPTASDLIV